MLKKFVAIGALLASSMAIADPALPDLGGPVKDDGINWVKAGLVVGGSLAGMYGVSKLVDNPNEHPRDYIAHGLWGAGITSYFIIAEDSPWVGLAAASVVGIGKELLDQNFEWQDAASTIAGSALTITVWKIKTSREEARLSVSPVGVQFTVLTK